MNFYDAIPVSCELDDVRDYDPNVRSFVFRSKGSSRVFRGVELQTIIFLRVSQVFVIENLQADDEYL